MLKYAGSSILVLSIALLFPACAVSKKSNSNTETFKGNTVSLQQRKPETAPVRIMP